MEKNSGTEDDLEPVIITGEDFGTEDHVVITRRQFIHKTEGRSRSNSPEPAPLNNRQEVTNSQEFSSDCKIILQTGPSGIAQADQRGSYSRRSSRLHRGLTSSQISPIYHDITQQQGTSDMAQAGRRGSPMRRSGRFSSVKEHGTGAETNRVWPDIRRGTSESSQLEYVEKVTELDRTSRDGILIKIIDRGCPNIPARVEHYEYWKVRNSRRAMKDYFDSNPELKAHWIKWNREFVMEAYKTEEVVILQSSEEED